MSTITMPASHASDRSKGLTLLFVLALGKFLFHLFVNATTAYGYFRDEFYYIACSDHLAWGYVDQPPFSVFMLKISRLIFGDSLVAIRVLPALAGAGVIFLTGLIVRRLGGTVFAMLLACLSVFVAPIYLGMNGYYSMNSFDQLFWTLSAYLLILIVRNPSKKLWLLLGVIMGLGVLNKVSILWLGAGIFLGLLATPQRRLLLTSGPWLAAGVAALLFLPHVIWQFTNDFPLLEFMENASAHKYVERSTWQFLQEQILLMHPFTFPIWISGIYFFLFHPRGRKYRIIAIIYLTTLLILLLNTTSKAEYLSPTYPMLLAGGAVLIGMALKERLTWLKSIFIVLLFSGGVLIMPLVVPVLSVESYIEYAKKLGQSPSTTEKKEMGELPQFYADMFGWDTMAKEVSTVYQKLTLREQEGSVFFGQNYGEAGAIDFYRKYYPLPRAISGHNNYWLWGPGEVAENAVVIILGGDKEDHLKVFEQVEQEGLVQSKYAMPYENNLPVYVCRHMKMTAMDTWPGVKHYD